MPPFPDGAPAAPDPVAPFLIVPGVLAERDGVQLSHDEADDVIDHLTVEVAGEAPRRFPVRVGETRGKQYLEVSLGPLLRVPALARALEGRFDPGRKSIRVHQLVAVVGRGSDLVKLGPGGVGVHHVNGATGDNRACNLRALRTATHDHVHAWEDALGAEALAARRAALHDDPERWADDLPADLRAAVTADRALLEADSPAEAPREEAEEEEKEVVEVEVEPYHPGRAPLAASRTLPALDDIQRLADRLGAPTAADLASLHARRLKLIQTAEALGCNAVADLLRRGHAALTPAAVAEWAEAAGARLVFDTGQLYRYNSAAGRYEGADDAFRAELVAWAEALGRELRLLTLVAGAWPLDAAAPVLRSLPRVGSVPALLEACRASLYRLWGAPSRMNGDQWTLNVANGLLDLRTQVLRPHSPEHLSSMQLPFPFDPGATCPCWERYLAEAVPDPAARAVLQEWMGYILLPITIFELALFLFGAGGTGKSTSLKVMRKLVGEDNCAAVGLEDLGEKFRVGFLRDKLLNVVTEVNPARALNDARFKAFVSGDPMIGENKNKDPNVMVPFARFVVAANTLPRILDQTDAFYRRVIMVRFDQKFVDVPDPAADPPERAKDPELLAKLDAEMPGILNWALAGLTALLARGRFDIPPSLQANVLAFREDQDNALRFLHDACVQGPGFSVSATDLYRSYVAWCRAQGEKPHANNRFGQVVARYPSVETKKNGSRGRYYRGLRPADTAAFDAPGGAAPGRGPGGEPAPPEPRRGEPSA